MVVITNKNLCKDDFLTRIEIIAKQKPKAIILREKELNHEEFHVLAKKIKNICEKYETTFFINSKIDIAKDLNIKNIQLSFEDFVKNRDFLSDFSQISVSIHSLNEALFLQDFPICFLIAGHIFETSCKLGLEPKGLKFLEDICNNSKLDIYAIGGINQANFRYVLNAGAKDFCIMSEAMIYKNIEKLKDRYIY